MFEDKEIYDLAVQLLSDLDANDVECVKESLTDLKREAVLRSHKGQNPIAMIGLYVQ
jgi:hypothetical protein